MSATPRGIHLVGSYPAMDDRTAMAEMLDVAGPLLRSLPSGETRRPRWMVEDLELLERNPAVQVQRRARDDYGSYDRVPRFRPQRGQKLEPESIQLTYHQYAADTWPVFEELREKAGLPDLRFQLGVPSPMEVPISAFAAAGPLGPVRALRAVPAFRTSYLREVGRIWADDRIGAADKTANLVFQLEFPVMVGALEQLPGPLQTDVGLPARLLVGELLARTLVKQIAGLPDRASVILHACNGDAGHKAFSRPRSMANIVMLVSKVIQHWPDGRTLAAVHLPFASGDRRPSTDPVYYRALASLGAVLPRGCRVAAGFVHEGESLDDQRRVQELIDASLNRRATIGAADVAYYCGYGRLTKPSLARAMLERSVTLASG